MKKYLAFTITAILAVCGSSCGRETSEEKNEVFESTSESSAEISEVPEETQEQTEALPELQECHKTIKNEEKPEVTRISFEGKCADNIKKHAKVSDLYNVDVLHSGVVGLIGVPIELEYDDEITEPRLTFTYDISELRGVPEKNRIMLHYSEKNAFYDTVEDFSLNTDNCTVSADIESAGVYLLADAYMWYGCWGMDVSEYEYERKPQDFPTDWERECDTGDIAELADKEWAMENAPNFRVSTPEQLASVVWYVNGICGLDMNVTLESDIDLSGYDWKPMGWSSGNCYFSGMVDGQGHTVKGMNIKEDYVQSGFIGYGMGITVKDITFEDANVSATHCTGIVGGEIYSSPCWENVHVSGYVNGGSDDYGAIIGREAGTTFNNCSADVIVNGEPMQYFSYRQKKIAETEVVETFTLTLNDDYSVTRDEHDGFRNLSWQVEQNGIEILQRNAENELTMNTHDILEKALTLNNVPGKYKIYLTAYIDGIYVRVSNIIEYDLE